MKTFSLEFFQKHGKRGGSNRSAAKATAARENGKQGGRPRLADSELSYAARKQRESRARRAKERK
jgi:hypothetical protein